MEADFWMHSMSKAGFVEEFTDEEFDLEAEKARIDAEAEAAADDWEDV